MCECLRGAVAGEEEAEAGVRTEAAEKDARNRAHAAGVHVCIDAGTV